MAAKRAKKASTKSSKSAKRTGAGTRKAGQAVARSKAQRPPRKQDNTPRPGLIAHTEFVSTDPDATQRFLRDGIGLSFLPSMPTPKGPYHMWGAEHRTGGGIRALAPGESPGAVPYIEVKGIKAGYSKALKAGASEVMPPMELPGGHGWMAIVKAPGGPMVGLWSNK